MKQWRGIRAQGSAYYTSVVYVHKWTIVVSQSFLFLQKLEKKANHKTHTPLINSEPLQSVYSLVLLTHHQLPQPLIIIGAASLKPSQWVWECQPLSLTQVEVRGLYLTYIYLTCGSGVKCLCGCWSLCFVAPVNTSSSCYCYGKVYLYVTEARQEGK